METSMCKHEIPWSFGVKTGILGCKDYSPIT